MRLEYLCNNCHSLIVPKQISTEEAITLSVDAYPYSENCLYFTVAPCKCTLGDKNTIVKAIQETLKKLEQ